MQKGKSLNLAGSNRMRANNSTHSIGEHLLAALTPAEIGRLLDVLLPVLPSELLENSLSELPLDTQHTIQLILTPSESSASKQARQDPPVSLAKLSQIWSERWQEELAPDTYKTLLAQWRSEHVRRK